MIEVFSFGTPIGKVPFFVWRRETSFLNFLHRIYVGKLGAPQPEYISLVNAYRVAGGLCTILLNKYIIVFSPWPRYVRDE